MKFTCVFIFLTMPSFCFCCSSELTQADAGLESLHANKVRINVCFEGKDIDTIFVPLCRVCSECGSKTCVICKDAIEPAQSNMSICKLCYETLLLKSTCENCEKPVDDGKIFCSVECYHALADFDAWTRKN